MRIHGLSSPHSGGCHDSWAVRNTRSGCGMMIVTRPSGVVSAAMPPGRAVRVRRVALGDLAAAVDEAGRDQAGALERRELRRVELGPALAVRDRDRDPRARHAAEQDRRAGLDPHQHQARLELLAAVAHEPRPSGGAGQQIARARRASGSRCTRRAGTCRGARRTGRTRRARGGCSGTSPPSRRRRRARRRTRTRRTRPRPGSPTDRRGRRPDRSCGRRPRRTRRAVNAAAISIWPLTPCSRRIATRGRAPVAMLAAARRRGRT